ncbi:uncharacterized protein LY89DRAFT_601174 [Mollisia scopiformis]|uniref:CSN8/PSMD8/EIF3K domain-containing protein n=1 Tax=Mollisia scopiformis TaxID=149040 RepID=A0A132B524_MOLSC|nr:uncharacterized protein LY89DRAFT_601174 [Mollisia scopiformis]KUJ07510.1 hypothetical protein LY89DRAFT_601174 [Mollisia scopiformis]
MSSRGGRAPSAPWGRLKQVSIDPLESIGLPSKGDDRLLNHRVQEQYYTKIVERFMAFCSDAGRGDELLRRLAQLEISPENGKSHTRSSIATDTRVESMMAGFETSNEKDISSLMMGMRKLREGIVASKRVDDFSMQAYIFCIRLSIQVKHMESYHPAILHLLKHMHTVQPLTNVELQEFVGYLVLDLACRQNDLAQAYFVRHTYGLHDSKVDAILHALSHDNYFLFWRVKHSVDGLKAKVMEFAEDAIKRQALKCLGRSYLVIDQKSLEEYTNTTWQVLVRDFGVGWQLDGSKVIIRKPKGR